MSKKLRTVLTLGTHGSRVRVYLEGDLVRVRWRVNGTRRHQSWPNTPENRAHAKAFAHGILDARREPAGKAPLRLTLRHLWERYVEAEFPSLRPKSQERYKERWGKLERFLGRDFTAEDITQENVDQYRTARTGIGIAVNQIAEEVKMAKVVYAWGQRRRLLDRNDLALYRFKIAKEDRSEPPAEYRMADFVRILAQFDPSLWGQWRPWAMLTLLGYQGVRTNSARHLQWADIEGNRVVWRARWDKVGREWHQPLRQPTIEALDVCRQWQEKQGYRGPWVFFSEDARRAKHNHEPVYGHQALAYALAKAEKKAGVLHLELRAMHGLRRMVVGEIVRITGDIAAAAQFIGDTDLRVVNRSYLKRRDDQLRDVADRLDDAHGRRGAKGSGERAQEVRPLGGAVRSEAGEVDQGTLSGRDGLQGKHRGPSPELLGTAADRMVVPATSQGAPQRDPEMVKPTVGLEPTTGRLRSGCSASELRRQATRKVHQTATDKEDKGVVALNEGLMSGFEPTTAPLTDPHRKPDLPVSPTVGAPVADQ